jgi:hypothetical protein
MAQPEARKTVSSGIRKRGAVEIVGRGDVQRLNDPQSDACQTRDGD